MASTDRYLSDVFVGKDIGALFKKVEEDRKKVENEFDKRYPSNKDWLDPFTNPHSKVFGRDIAEFLENREGFAGKQLAVLIRPEFRDLDATTVEGELLPKKDETGFVDFYLVSNGNELRLNTNDILSVRIEDTSFPKYREILNDLRRDGFINVSGLDAIGEDAELAYLSPDLQKGIWNLEKARNEEYTDLRGIFVMEARGSGDDYRWEVDTSSVESCNLFVKPRIVY